jgi:hypothetical protein
MSRKTTASSRRTRRGGPKVASISELLDALEKLTRRKHDISLRDALEAVGHRSFGPLLLLAGLVMAAPGVGDIPGVPTGVGIFVALVAGQMVLRRQYVWLPNWLLERSVSDRLVATAVKWLRPPARAVDVVTRRRLVNLTHDAGALAIALASVVFALVTPLMEVVLFSANIAGVALAAFGLALIAHDGLIALFGFAMTAVWVAVLAWLLIG